MAIAPAGYSRSQTLDVRAAMAHALARRLTEATFDRPDGGIIKFANVFTDWPSFTDRYISPSACILPTGWAYDAARLTPSLIEETWEPKGKPGFGLYRTADINTNFDIIIRAASDRERSDVLIGVENLWTSDNGLMDDAGARYGLVVDMPEYWSVCAGFALLSARVIDDEDRAMREHREAILTVTGQAPQVKLGPVRPMRLTVRLDPDC